jgi:hypothetical protein
MVLSANPDSVTCFAPAILASADVESIRNGASDIDVTKSIYLSKASGVAPNICTILGFHVKSVISSIVFNRVSALSLSKIPLFSSDIIL